MQLKRGPDFKQDLFITLEEFYFGTERYMNLERNEICSSCHGTGAKDGKVKTCNQCHGTGQVLQNVQGGMGMTVQMQAVCPKCRGKGTTHKANCPICKGRKVVKKDK